MLSGEDLAAVAQRTLRQQADFGEAIQDNPVGLGAFEGFENALGRLTEFEIGGIEQALLLIFVEQAFWRHQFENLEPIAERPTMRRRALAQFGFGFRERDVEGLSPAAAPVRTNCVAIVVLPVPGLPSRRKSRPRRKPPAVTLSISRLRYGL